MSDSTTFEVRKIYPGAILPTKKRLTDAAYDLYSPEAFIVPANGKAAINLGLAIAPPDGWYYTIEGRSGLGSRGIVPFHGVIDTGYTGMVSIVLFNHASEDYQVENGDRIAQLIPHRKYQVEFKEVEDFSSEYNQRGDNGFGSSGK